MIYVDGVPLSIDVAAWMHQTQRFNKIKTSTEREWIEATCPFHDERDPSFAVNVVTGRYRCLACGAHGNFVQLVKYVERHDTLFDAQQSLLARFGRFVPDTEEDLTLDFGDGEGEMFVDVHAMKAYIEPYCGWLKSARGITAETQERFGVGYLPSQTAVAMPWFDVKGRLVTVKYRSILDKRFWYDPPVEGGRLRRLLFGFHIAKDADLIVVCEGEIDAMSVYQAGFAAVALGGTNLSGAQAQLLRNAKADEIVVFTDHDEAGCRARDKIVSALVGHKQVSVIDWSLRYGNGSLTIGDYFKDANDILTGYGELLRRVIEHRIPASLSLAFN